MMLEYLRDTYGVECSLVGDIPDEPTDTWARQAVTVHRGTVTAAQIVDAARKALAGEIAAPAPATITKRQLVLALLAAGRIGAAEAEAWAAGNALPADLVTAIDTLPAADRPAARITVLTMTEVNREDPLTALVASAIGAAADDIDTLWSAGATL